MILDLTDKMLHTYKQHPQKYPSILNPHTLYEINYRPECVAGVNDSMSRRWWATEVSVSNLWKDNEGQKIDKASC